MLTGHDKKERGSRYCYGILEISIDLFDCQCAGGDERFRTADPLLAKQVLSQLSYIPWGADAPRYSDTFRCLPPHADGIGRAGGFQTLKVCRVGETERNPESCLLVEFGIPIREGFSTP